MEQKKNKYDTNPLDPDVARRTDDVWNDTRSPNDAPGEAEDVWGAKRANDRTPQQQAHEDFGGEAPTRRYDTPKMPASYPSVFVPPVYEPPSAQGAASGIHSGASSSPPTQGGAAAPFNQPPTSRSVANINLPENVVLMLPYLPFPYIGAVVAALLLFLVPRGETRVRFHASQGLALHLLVVAVSILTGMVDNFLSGPPGVMLKIASAGFSVLAFIFFIVSMIRVYKGEPHVVTPVADLARWLNEKIEPRK
ncbi:MAG TPA: hypothetical protein VGC66_01005 [Pyrinomonadaceae bacterium]|jgi:uncharacterized membrane protein